jgi:hypothetical protein
MPGGLLNLAATGNQNVMIHGNPTKTFFKSTYAKHTNFGMQKFRIDFQGQRRLQLNTQTDLTFIVPRYADLLMDIYLVIDLPNIWSSVLPPDTTADPPRNIWSPYEFKWIKNIGTNLIKEVRFTIGGHLIQSYTGSYLQNVIERDFDENKKKLFDIMTGNTDELNDPAKFYNGNYPNAFNFNESSLTYEILPSIRKKRLYIPINVWFTLMSKMAFPLISLQYNELQIEFRLRPINELFVVRDIDHPNNYDYTQTPYIRANQNMNRFQLFRFLEPPPSEKISSTSDNSYNSNINNWNSNIHILANYCFLDNDEVRIFTSKPQQYLIKEFREYTYHELVGSNNVEIETNGLVSNFMFFFQRNDIILRNEWSNYSNWQYQDQIPNIPERRINDLSIVSTSNGMKLNSNLDISQSLYDISMSYLMYFTKNYDMSLNTSIDYFIANQKNILNEFAILLDGKYRENLFSEGVYNYIDYYIRSCGKGKEGLYFYNFGLGTNPFSNQPNGAINLAKFNRVEFQTNIIRPPLNPFAQVIEICDDDGNLIGIDKTANNLHEYTFDLTVQEERYNMLLFTNGNAQLMFA